MHIVRCKVNITISIESSNAVPFTLDLFDHRRDCLRKKKHLLLRSNDIILFWNLVCVTFFDAFKKSNIES